MTNRQIATDDPISLTLALPLAQAYADIGIAEYNKFAEPLAKSIRDGAKFSFAHSISAFACGTVLALSAELFLKALVFQRTGGYPSGHDLSDLVNRLPTQTRATLGERHETLKARDQSFLRVRIKLSDRSPEDAPDRSDSGVSAPPKDGDFESFVRRASPMFVRLRYVYEKATCGFSEEVDFQCLILLIENLRAEICSMKDGTLTLKLDGGSIGLLDSRQTSD